MKSWIARAASYGDLVDVSVRKEREMVDGEMRDEMMVNCEMRD